MKILYGVQGTGQGHVSRSRAMAEALNEWPVDVTWLFSGRPREALFDMDVFGDFEHRRGLTFICEGGRIDKWATLRQNNFLQFVRDVRQLDLSDYDPMANHNELHRGFTRRSMYLSKLKFDEKLELLLPALTT